MASKRVLIVGAGGSGLPAIKACLDEGLEPVCVERSDDLGGLWRYTNEAVEGQACVMRSTVINTSKEMMCYSDFPIPDDFANFMHNRKVLEYFRLYADKFQLNKYIRYNTEVVIATPADDFKDTGRWNVKLNDMKTGQVTPEVFDAIMVCTGHHAEKRMPDFPGMKDFKGKIVHSHDYKDHRGYEGKRVVIVGIGNSGVDCAVELARITNQTYLSTRRGAWVLNRVDDYGMPTDVIAIKRINQYLLNILPSNVLNTIVEAKVNKRFDHATYGIRPSHRFNAQHPTVNDDLPNRVLCGSLVIKPQISQITATGVQFEDGSTVDDIDVIIVATGYKFGFPVIDKSVLDVKNNEVNLFKYVFPPDLAVPSLAIIGCIQPLGSVIPISEMQCRWATRVFKGVTKLPPRSDMEADIAKKKSDMAGRYVKSPRHTIQVDYILYMDELAEQFGVRPDLSKLLMSDPLLWGQVLFGPVTPYQYRIHGPGAWPKARDAIMSQWERIMKPLKTRPVDQVSNSNWLLRALLVVALAMLLRVFGIW